MSEGLVFLSSDLLLCILRHLSVRSIVRSRRVCKRWCEVISKCSTEVSHGRSQWLWKGLSFKTFMIQMNLPKPLLELLLDGHWDVKTTLRVVQVCRTLDEIKNHCIGDREDFVRELVVAEIVTQQQADAMPLLGSFRHYKWCILAVHLNLLSELNMAVFKLGNLFQTPHGLVALQKKLITQEELALLSPTIIRILFETRYGIVALDSGLISVQHVKQFDLLPEGSWLLQYLLVDLGIAALEKGTLTVDQVLQLPDYLTLKDFYVTGYIEKKRRIEIK